jgi:hypothetical protein
MTSASGESGGLVREGAVGCIGEGAAGRGTGVHTIRIAAEFGSRSGVLQVVGASVLGHPTTFNPGAFLEVGAGHRAEIVLSAPFPAVLA